MAGFRAGLQPLLRILNITHGFVLLHRGLGMNFPVGEGESRWGHNY